MKLHLPVLLRKAVLSCLVSVVLCTMGSGVAWAENLSFEGESLTWDTQTESFTNEDKAAAAFAPGDNVSFSGESTVTLGEDISAGTVAIEKGADVTIDLDVFELNVDRIELSGSLDMGDFLNIGAGSTLSMEDSGAVLNSNLVMGEKGVLSVTGAGGSLNGHALAVQNGASLILTGAVVSRETTDVDQDGELSLIVTPTGDGKTYTLLADVNQLYDKTGNALTAGEYAINEIFDSSRPGSGFWADGTLVYAADGSLTLVRHNETVKEAQTIGTQQCNPSVYQYYSRLSFENISSSAVFLDHTDITLSDNGSVEFRENSADYSGGAIGMYHDCVVSLIRNGSVAFSDNTASYDGGAITGGYDSVIMLSDNGSVSFIGNEVLPDFDDRGGGAISGAAAAIELNNNGSVIFGENAVQAYANNAHGGAIYGRYISVIMLSDNASVSFIGNEVNASSFASGGAISMYNKYEQGGPDKDGSITLSDNASVSFIGNEVNASSFARGGAISMYTDYDIGGPDKYGSITLSDNGSVRFSGNMASASYEEAYGGAIYSNCSLSIRNNDSVLFEKNVEKQGNTYRLRSIYVGGSDAVISLSAAADKSIEFRDSVYVDLGVTVNLNEDYTYEDADGKSVTIKQTGDIIFTGATTEDDLYAVKGSVGTPDEILNSRTSEILEMTHLYGGRLRVEDGAIYQGLGITAHAGSKATVLVKDATLNHVGCELHFFEGTKLEAQGESVIFGDVIVESTATAAFSALTRLEGGLTLAAGAELSLDGELTLNGTLTLGRGLTLSGDILADIKNLAAGQSITLVSGLESLTVQMQTLMRSLEYTTVMTGQELVAADYFSNLQTDSGYVLIYNGATGALTVTQSIPEPTTATLSLLALAALAVRRRRK